MIKELKFYCQKILPLVYDDSLSYYELLNKLTNKINEIIPKVNELDTNITEAVNEILDEWKEDGTLDQIINDNIFEDLQNDIRTETENRLASDLNLSKYLNLIGHGFDTCEIITVGQGNEYDYQNLVEAVHYANSLTDVPCIIAVYRGTWNTNGDSSQYGLTLENNKVLYGMGSRTTVNIVGNNFSDNLNQSTLNLKDNCAIFNCFINGNGGKYTIHDDFHNEGDTLPQYRYIYNCEIYGQNNASGNTYGAGIKSNQHVTIENTLIYSFDNLPMRFHNWTNCEQDSFIALRNCIIRPAWGFYGLRLSVLNNYNGYTNYKPVWVNVENCEINGGIVIRAEANNPSTNVFHLNCDDAIPIKCEVGALIVDAFAKPFKMLHANIDASLVGRCVCQSGAPHAYTGFGGGNDIAVIGYGYDQTKIAIKGILEEDRIFQNLTLGVHDKITITQTGDFEVNGNGRTVGFKDANNMIHFNFEI